MPIGNHQVRATIELSIEKLGAKTEQIETWLTKCRLAGPVMKQST